MIGKWTLKILYQINFILKDNNNLLLARVTFGHGHV